WFHGIINREFVLPEASHACVGRLRHSYYYKSQNVVFFWLLACSRKRQRQTKTDHALLVSDGIKLLVASCRYRNEYQAYVERKRGSFDLLQPQ
ncbi:hypothetical protein L9F63_008874, partial [Diploptera punctata]